MAINTYIKKEKNSNKQSNFTPQGATKRKAKSSIIRGKETIKIRAELNKINRKITKTRSFFLLNLFCWFFF